MKKLIRLLYYIEFFLKKSDFKYLLKRFISPVISFSIAVCIAFLMYLFFKLPADQLKIIVLASGVILTIINNHVWVKYTNNLEKNSLEKEFFYINSRNRLLYYILAITLTFIPAIVLIVYVSIVAPD